MLLFATTVMLPHAAAADGITQLSTIDQKIVAGAVARDAMQVELNYNGWLYDDNAKDHHVAIVDSSFDHGKTISFTLGEGNVITG